MSGLPRALLIEDDEELGEQIVPTLGKEGFEVTWWTEGRVPEPSSLDLLIVDLMLPGMYGMDILAELRAKSDVPVLVLSARSDTMDKVRALELGADDYVTKPFGRGSSSSGPRLESVARTWPAATSSVRGR